MNLNDLTIGQAKELASLFSQTAPKAEGLSEMIGQDVIVRTYSAGVFFGTLSRKSGNEVILTEARRMWQWKAAQSISLSAVAIHGIDASNSKIAEALASIWLEAIEIIPCSSKACKSIQEAPIVKAS